MVALDLLRAFDTVNLGTLLSDILHLTLKPLTIKRWLSNYLRGRQTMIEFNGNSSKYRKMKQGVPQGGVLSPILFIMYMSSLPTPTDDLKIVSYADDISILATDNDIQMSCDKINSTRLVQVKESVPVHREIDSKPFSNGIVKYTRF